MNMVCCVSVILDVHILVSSVAPIIRSAIGKGPIYQKNIGYNEQILLDMVQVHFR